jgi:predicted DNA-binding ArsR family transcriptional regulator
MTTTWISGPNGIVCKDTILSIHSDYRGSGWDVTAHTHDKHKIILYSLIKENEVDQAIQKIMKQMSEQQNKMSEELVALRNKLATFKAHVKKRVKKTKLKN